MSRRRDLERIYQARRAGILARLTSSGVPPDHAVTLMDVYEAQAVASGLGREDNAYWDDAWAWLEPRRWTKPQAI